MIKSIMKSPLKLIFSYVLWGLETVETYFMQQDIRDSIFSSLHKVENHLFRFRNQGNSQTSITQHKI